MLRAKNLAGPYITSYKNLSKPNFVPIAPNPVKEMDCTVTRKYTYKSNYTGAQAASIARRNARERNRVKQVNDGFNALRKRLPVAIVNALSGGARRGSGKKLSKVDTLRMVVEYIRYLERLINETDVALGVAKDPSVPMDKHLLCDFDEGVYGGRSSPYSDSVPSPADSECSSGVSSSYSTGNDCYNKNLFNETNPVDDSELLDAITWWQKN